MSRRAIRKRRHRQYELKLLESPGNAWAAFEADIQAELDRMYRSLFEDITVFGGGSYAAAEVMRRRL